MDIIMIYMYTYLILGIVLGLSIALAMVMFQKKIWPLIHVCIELRNDNKVATILKAKKTTDKNGKVSYFTKPAVLSHGLKGLFTRPIIMPPPKYSDITVMKEGGNMLLSFSPTRNVFLPVKLEVKEEEMKMIPKFNLLKTWFKSALIDLTKNKLLRPQLKWERIVPIAMMGMFIIVLVMFIITVQSIPKSMTTITDTFGNFVMRIEQSTGTISGSATQIGNPIG